MDRDQLSFLSAALSQVPNLAPVGEKRGALPQWLGRRVPRSRFTSTNDANCTSAPRARAAHQQTSSSSSPASPLPLTHEPSAGRKVPHQDEQDNFQDASLNRARSRTQKRKRDPLKPNTCSKACHFRPRQREAWLDFIKSFYALPECLLDHKRRVSVRRSCKICASARRSSLLILPRTSNVVCRSHAFLNTSEINAVLASSRETSPAMVSVHTAPTPGAYGGTALLRD